MSPSEKQIEQLLTDYFRNKMPEAIRRLPESEAVHSQIQTTTTHATTPQWHSLSAVISLAAASCALVMVVIAVGIPFNNPASKSNAERITSQDEIVKRKARPSKTIPAADVLTSKPVEMQNNLQWVKRIHVDPRTGERTERIEPKLNLIPDTRILILPLDDDEFIEENEEE